MIKTVGEIIRKFRTEGACIKFSPKTISYMAGKLGYHIRRYGGKVGYDQSLITDLQRHWKELNEYDKAVKEKAAQKQNKRANIASSRPDYNPDKFHEPEGRIDYSWEIKEEVVERIIESIINDFLNREIL